MDTPEFAHIHGDIDHDLREALTISKGWLEMALRNWRTLPEDEREIMVTAALFGTNRIAFLLDVMEGRREEDLTSPPERVAEDLLRIADAATNEGRPR